MTGDYSVEAHRVSDRVWTDAHDEMLRTAHANLGNNWALIRVDARYFQIDFVLGKNTQRI
jgi:hypothetical protein